MKETVAILGASKDPTRFAYRAFKMLQEHGHTPIPVTPKFAELEGVKAFASLKEITSPIDTLTMYVGPAISEKLAPEILALKPKRVVFNPGSENPQLAEKLRQAGVEVVEHCTLVMLRSGEW